LLIGQILLKCYICSIASYGAETWTFRKVDHIYLEVFAMWCWRRMDKTSWIGRVRNEIELRRAREERNILHTTETRNNWIGHILCWDCLLKRVIEGKMEGRIKWLEEEEEDVGSSWMTWRRRCWGYWKWNEEVLDRTVWRTRFGKGWRSVARWLHDDWQNQDNVC